MNRIERLHAEERLVQLAADAIQRRHPQASWLVEHGRIGQTGLTERALEGAIERLEAWLADSTRQE